MGTTSQQQPPSGYSPSGGTRNNRLLTWTEGKTHFYAWCIVSSPLILGTDLTNKSNLDLYWPIISNREAIEVSEAWVGDPGVLIKQSNVTGHMPHCPHMVTETDPACDFPLWLIWKKALPDGKAALLLMNNANSTANVTVSWEDLPKGTVECASGLCHVRDLHTHKDLGDFNGGFTASLASHDSAFIVVSGKVQGEVAPLAR